jgi:hypothetical protein
LIRALGWRDRWRWPRLERRRNISRGQHLGLRESVDDGDCVLN